MIDTGESRGVEEQIGENHVGVVVSSVNVELFKFINNIMFLYKIHTSIEETSNISTSTFSFFQNGCISFSASQHP